MLCLFSILSIYIHTRKITYIYFLFLKTQILHEKMNWIVLIQYNGNNIAAATGISCKLQQHFLNTRLNRDKTFIILTVYEAKRPPRLNYIPNVFWKCFWGRIGVERRSCSWWDKLRTTDAELAQTSQPELRQRNWCRCQGEGHCSELWALCWMWEISRMGISSWNASWM